MDKKPESSVGEVVLITFICGVVSALISFLVFIPQAPNNLGGIPDWGRKMGIVFIILYSISSMTAACNICKKAFTEAFFLVLKSPVTWMAAILGGMFIT